MRINYNDPKMMFFGTWRESEGYMETYLRFQTCFLSFYGSWVRLLIDAGPDCGQADVLIDGVFYKSIDADGEEAPLFEASHIEGEHLHVLELVTGKNRRLRIRGFEAETPVNYVDEMKRLKEEEYAVIKSGKKECLPPAEWKRVTTTAAPGADVSLEAGFWNELFERNIKLLIHDAGIENYCDGDDRLEWIPGNNPGDGWTKWLPASNDGRMLAGAANTYRFTQRADMKEIMNKILAAISEQVREDSYYNYYPEADSFALTRLSGQTRRKRPKPHNKARTSV